jgi:hypothetical protein
MRFRICSLTLAALFPLSAFAQDKDPYITQTVVNYSANTLTVSGSNLLGDGGGGVASMKLTGTALTVTNSSTTSITAKFPSSTPASSYAPGDYLLTITFHAAKGHDNNFDDQRLFSGDLRHARSPGPCRC